MRYDFDRVIDRRGTDSIKWDIPEDVIPMWVADMDFETAPAVVKAISDRAAHGIYGYTKVPDEWYEAYIGWWMDRHNYAMKKEWLMFSTGIIPTISSCVRKLTTPNENVIIQTPVYHIFFNSILNNGARVLENPLVFRDGAYSMDYEDLEKKMADPQTTLMILCNPHNPCGRIWSKPELRKVAELAYKHNVTVISDEIHCDITAPGFRYVPFGSVSEEARQISITCISPTKTFNIAGIQTSAVCVPDPLKRHKVWRAINTDEVAEPNCFACIAAIAAFREGEGWLDELRAYISENRKFAEMFINKRIPGIRVIDGKATYLMWADISEYTDDSRTFCRDLRKETGLFVSDGSVFGGTGSFIRVNLACPRDILTEGLLRLEKFTKDLRKKDRHV
jgi:cystathionine beta-lyase